MSEQITLHQLFSSRIDVKTKDEKRFTLKVCNSKRGEGRYALIVYDKYNQRNIMVVETFKNKLIMWFDSLLAEYSKGNTIVIDKIGIEEFKQSQLIKEVAQQVKENYESTQERRVDQAV